jgi:tetratricopeptide (TPR) repeat protein
LTCGGKQYLKAEKIYRKIIASWPSNGKTWLGLGNALDRNRDFLGAKFFYEKAVQLPNYSLLARLSLEKIAKKPIVNSGRRL